MVRRPDLLLARISVLTGCGADSLSSFGGEGQGEEAVVLSQAGHALLRQIVGKSPRTPASRIVLASSPQPSPPKEERENHSPGARVHQPRVCNHTGRGRPLPALPEFSRSHTA